MLHRLGAEGGGPRSNVGKVPGQRGRGPGTDGPPASPPQQEEEKASTVQLERERQNLLSQLEEYERRQAKLQQELAVKESQLGSLEVKAAQAGTQSDLPVAPGTPASRRFQVSFPKVPRLCSRALLDT